MKTLISPPGVAPIVVRHATNAQFDIQIRGHRLVVDQTTKGGGEDVGPEPIELLGAALGSCVAYYVNQFCRARALESDGLEVTVDHRMVDTPRRVGRFAVAVRLPAALPERYMEMIERVARSCPAHNTLVRGADVDVTIIRDA